MHTTVSMQVTEAETDVVPVWWHSLLCVARVIQHADVVQGVRAAQPTDTKSQLYRHQHAETKLHVQYNT